MNTNTSNKLIEYIRIHSQATAKELADFLGISRQALYKHLGKFLKDGTINKIGFPPKVFYRINIKATEGKTVYINSEDKQIINKNYLFITPAGEKLEGVEGFVYWCNKNNLDINKTVQEYIKTLQKFNSYKVKGLVNGLPKLKNTFGEVFLDKLFYLDFYSIEHFGKTRLGQLLLYAKQSQNKQLIKDLVVDIKPKIEKIIKQFKIQAIGFIPPTVKRETQFMKELQINLRTKLPIVSIVKIKSIISVPQKSLSKLQDRVENAEGTIFVNEKRIYKNILLLDDAVGSGATLNITAKKIIEQKLCSGKLIGLSITGSFKGFDVISEV